MAREAQTQKRLITYLKSKGCYVIKLKPEAGRVPVGAPDILALHEGWWGAFEVKGSKTAKFQPLQKETIAKLNEWSTAWVVYPENLDRVIADLERMF